MLDRYFYVPVHKKEQNENANDEHKKIYSKATKKELRNKILFSDEEIKLYYEQVVETCLFYSRAFSYFANAETIQKAKIFDHTVLVIRLYTFFRNNKNKDKLFSIFIKEIEYNKDKKKFLRDNKIIRANFGKEKYLEKNEVVKCLAEKDKNIIETFYPEYVHLKKSIRATLELLSDKKLKKVFLKIINERILIENSKRNLGDRLDYYCTLNDKQIYSLFVAPIVNMHGILFSIAMPHISSPALFIIMTGSLKGLGISTANNYLSHLVKVSFNAFLRKNTSYEINGNLCKNNIEDFNIEVLKKYFQDLKQIATRSGQFNYYFSNSFKYYCKLKEECDSIMFSNKLFLEQNIYNKKISEIESLYYKTLNYSRSSKILLNTLKTQITILKDLLLQSTILLCNNEDINKVFSIYKNLNESENTNLKLTITNCLFTSYYVSNNKNLRVLVDLIFLIISSPIGKVNKNILLNEICPETRTSLKQDTLEQFDNLGIQNSFPKKTLMLLDEIPEVKNYLSNFEKEDKELISYGPWFAFTTVEGILYSFNSNKMMEKYNKIKLILSRGVSAINIGQYIVGFSDFITSLFGVILPSGLTALSINPLTFILDLTSAKIGNMVSENNKQIWRDIKNDFEKFKKEYRSNVGAWCPSYEYFRIKRKSDPGEAMHKLSDLFKVKLENIAKTACEINSETMQIKRDIEKYNSKSFQFFRIKEKYIIEKFTKIFMKILILSNELKSYEDYLNYIANDINSEIEESLKLYFTLISIKDRGVFSILRFITFPEVYTNVFGSMKETGQ